MLTGVNPWVEPAPDAAKWARIGLGLQGLAIALVIGAYVLALAGFLVTADALAEAARAGGLLK
jgi:hypothetical protein